MEVTELQRCFGKLVEDKDYQDGMEFKFRCFTGDKEFIYGALTNKGIWFEISFVPYSSIDLFDKIKIEDYFDDEFDLFDCYKSSSACDCGTFVFKYYPSAENSTFGKDRVIKN